MFKNKTFYHSHIRNAMAAFGALFDNITIKRINTSNNIAQAIKVPLTYGVKQKFIARIGDAPDLASGRAPFEIVVPMMAYVITGFKYAPERKLLPMQKVRAINPAGGVQQGFVWTPYDIGVRLSVLVKNQDDGFQIFEQIAPYFSPDFSVPINELPELGVVHNIQFVLDNVNMNEENAEGDFSKRLAITWDLDFTVKVNFFGYIDDVGLIKTVIQNIYAVNAMDDITANSIAGERIITTPNPFDADPSGEFTYLQEFSTIYLPTTTTTTQAP